MTYAIFSEIMGILSTLFLGKRNLEGSDRISMNFVSSFCFARLGVMTFLMRIKWCNCTPVLQDLPLIVLVFWLVTWWHLSFDSSIIITCLWEWLRCLYFQGSKNRHNYFTIARPVSGVAEVNSAAANHPAAQEGGPEVFMAWEKRGVSQTGPTCQKNQVACRLVKDTRVLKWRGFPRKTDWKWCSFSKNPRVGLRVPGVEIPGKWGS